MKYIRALNCENADSLRPKLYKMLDEGKYLEVHAVFDSVEQAGDNPSAKRRK